MKKVIVMIVCCVVAAACVFQFTGCKKESSSAEDVLKKYIEAQDDETGDAVIDLLPPDVYDYMYNVLDSKEHEYTEEEIRNTIILSGYRTKGPNAEISYEIIDKYVASADEIAAYSEFNSEKYGFDDKIDAITLIKYNYEGISESGLGWSDIDNAVCMKVNGSWYILSDANGQNKSYWKIDDSDCVEWICNWFAN